MWIRGRPQLLLTFGSGAAPAGFLVLANSVFLVLANADAAVDQHGRGSIWKRVLGILPWEEAQNLGKQLIKGGTL